MSASVHDFWRKRIAGFVCGIALGLSALPPRGDAQTILPGSQGRLKVAVFSDPDGGSTASDCIQSTVSILGTNGFDVSTITAAAIRAGGLKAYDVVMFPGGSGTGQAAALHQDGCAQVAQFVAKGGGYVGTCAGAYLAAAGYNTETSWLEIVNARILDIKHWDRGTGDVQVHIVKPANAILAGVPEYVTVHYLNGPLLGPGSATNLPTYETGAVFSGDVHAHGPAGVMPGTAAMTTSTYQSGRCVLFSFHPELTPGLEQMDVRAVKWAAGKL